MTMTSKVDYVCYVFVNTGHVRFLCIKYSSVTFECLSSLNYFVFVLIFYTIIELIITKSSFVIDS